MSDWLRAGVVLAAGAMLLILGVTIPGLARFVYAFVPVGLLLIMAGTVKLIITFVNRGKNKPAQDGPASPADNDKAAG